MGLVGLIIGVATVISRFDWKQLVSQYSSTTRRPTYAQIWARNYGIRTEDLEPDRPETELSALLLRPWEELGR